MKNSNSNINSLAGLCTVPLALLCLVLTPVYGSMTLTSGHGRSGPDFKVVAYVPSWTGTAADIPYKDITHINYMYIRPTLTGGLTDVENSQKLYDVISKAHDNHVLVGITVGGRSDFKNDDFQAMAANTGYRRTFINNLSMLLRRYQLDGVDIDWEFPSNVQDQMNFATLLEELELVMHTQGKFLSAAVAANGPNADGIKNTVFKNVDFLNLLVYNGGVDADHSPYSYAKSSLDYWLNRGLPAAKAVLGIPFHSQPAWKSYKTLVTEGANPNIDVQNGNYYNGVYTVKQKTDLAFTSNIGGVMISNLSHDVSGINSLVSAINQVIDQRLPNRKPISSFAGMRHTIPGILEAEHFDTGGEGISYHDLTPGNGGGAFRFEDVDIEVNTNMIDDHKISGIQAGEWLNYTVDVITDGPLKLQVSVAAVSDHRIFHIEIDGIDISGKLTVPNTGGWQNWQTVTATTPSLTRGKKLMRIVMDTGDFSINKIAFSHFLSSDKIPASVESEAATTGLSLYPNPGASGTVQNMTLTFDSYQSHISVSVNDINGYGVFLQNYIVEGTAATVGLPGLLPGLYTVRIKGDKKSWTKKYLVK